MESQEEKTNPIPTTTPTVAPMSKYSNRVLLKTIREDGDGGLGLVGNRVIIGGWVKSSREVKKELPPPISTEDHGAAVAFGPQDKGRDRDVSCVEILQSRIPFFRTIIKVLSGGSCGGGGVGVSSVALGEKLEPAIPKPTPQSVVYLLVNDGSCLGNLQVVVDSAIAAPNRLLPIGTCILVEGVLQQPSVDGKHVVELKTEKILHIGTVDHDKYPLSKKRIHMDTLRDCAHFRPRTTTVASVMRIRSALTFATHTFFQNNGFLYVEVPVITSTDCEGFSEKFQVTTLLEKADKEEPTAANVEGVTLDNIKDAIREKSNLVEELKRSENNKEALAAALQDLKKTNEIAAQLAAREKQKQPSVKTDKINFSEDFFSRQTYLTVSGRLHLESYASALGYVYSLGPRFRAEKTESAKHAAEMWMVEIEMAFSQLEDAMNCAEDYFKSLCKWLVVNCSQELNFVSKRIDKTISECLQSVISNPFEKLTYTDAVKVLGQVTDRTFETKLEWGVALTAEHLSYLADVKYKRPVAIYDYPKAVKPFYVRLNDDGYTVAAFDMVVPKVGTLIRGSQNEERLDMLITRIKDLGLPSEQYEWYLDLRRHGTVKHSGFSLGIDHMVLFTTGLANVRDAIPFPRSLGKANN